jgi:hypothetical protein
VPQLRNLYKKIGRFFGILFQPLADTGHFGDQIKGFGFQHDGSAGRTNDPADAFLIAFESTLKPIVGQQMTLSAASGEEARARVAVLEQRAAAGDCELVAHAVVDDEARGWLYDGEGGYLPDRSDAASVSAAEIGLLDGVTFTCVPPGSGFRAARDRDRDGALDGDERLLGTDPADPASFPGAPTPTAAAATATSTATEGATAAATPSPTSGATVPAAATATATGPPTERPTAPLVCDEDCDGDARFGAAELRLGIGLLFGAASECGAAVFDGDRDGRVRVADLLAAARRDCGR